jgi:hypothetical protein
MRVLLGNGGGAALRLLMETRPEFGNLLSPLGWRTPLTQTWACDNDVFSSWDKSHDLRLSAEKRSYWADFWKPCGHGEDKWFRMLDKIPRDNPPMWVLLPDVIADWPATLARARQYRMELAMRGLRVAVALQDGCRYEEALRLLPDAVFVGGTKRWKWSHLEAICAYFQPRGTPVHVGRVSGVKGIAECLRLGVDSCDGTGWVRAPDQELPRLLRALDQRQPRQQRAFEF